MFVATIAILTSSLLNLQTPVTVTSPPLQESFTEPQNFENLLLVAPIKLVKQATKDPSYRAYVGEVKITQGTTESTTEFISVVVTDLEKIDPIPTAEQICELHDRASRTRGGNAGQLFKTERTTINDQPMVVLIGSIISRDANQKAVNMYQASAAFSTDKKAYEITWITLNGGVTLTNAIKSVRNASLQIDNKIFQPKLLVGTQGSYTFLGVPYKFVLPAPVEALPDTLTNEEESGRYIGRLTGNDWFATAEIAVRNSEISDTSPENLMKLLGYEKWVAQNPKFENKDGTSICSNFAITDKRHARIEIAYKDKIICAVIVSADNDKELPPRDEIALTP
ncbi:MAG: hypothetical protein ACKVQS_00800 [Fimbriimonadaceae bacterium]